MLLGLPCIYSTVRYIEMYFLIPVCVCVCVATYQTGITQPAIWINPFVGILTIIALWPVAIMFIHLKTALQTIKIVPKYAMYQVSMHEHFLIKSSNNSLTL